jgi:hypothetical protein
VPGGGGGSGPVGMTAGAVSAASDWPRSHAAAWMDAPSPTQAGSDECSDGGQ